MIMRPSDHSRFQQAHDFVPDFSRAVVATALWAVHFPLRRRAYHPLRRVAGENGGVKQHKRQGEASRVSES
jgi:hypothetical protein